MHDLSRDDIELLKLRAELQGSLLLFIKFFYKILNGRDFVLSEPIGRESHYITIARELTKVFNLETNRLLINIPPGHGKSTMLIYFVAWAMSQYPDSQFLYISYSHDLAAKHTATIKQIMSLTIYKKIFNVNIRKDSSAKDKFMTESGGCVSAFGSSGGITGQDAGLPNLNRFSGCVLMDDMHKPDEVHSDTMRENVINNYNQTIKPRRRADNVPLFSIGQRLHEADISQFLIDGKDGYDWRKIILKAIDEVGNVLAPNIISKESLLIEQKHNQYVYSSQYQQEPIPAGGSIFRPEWFVLTDENPEILETFLCIDTAETAKDYNDETVFSFFGIYKLPHLNNEFAIHWIDCFNFRCEPRELEDHFLDFYNQCCFYEVKPTSVLIEKKSTGVTLSSVLNSYQGLRIIEIERTKASGSKAVRHLEMQPFIAQKRISLPRYGKHTHTVIEHMRKITANNTHRHDDICDTLYDAYHLVNVNKTITRKYESNNRTNAIVEKLAQKHQNINRLKNNAYRAKF